jgi:hypothetical protein
LVHHQNEWTIFGKRYKPFCRGFNSIIVKCTTIKQWPNINHPSKNEPRNEPNSWGYVSIFEARYEELVPEKEKAIAFGNCSIG